MKIQRIISCFLILILIFSNYSILNSSATTNSISTTYTIISKNTKLESRLTSGWAKLKRKIYVEDLNISVSYLNTAYYHCVHNNPEYFYVETRFEYEHVKDRILNIIPSYSTTDTKKISKMKKEIETEANKILKGINKNMSTYDKCLYIHDMLAQHISYKNIGANAFTLYGPLVKKYGVCQGYVYAYSYLLKRVGITSVAVTSKTMSHAWNKVKIGNDYYHVDVTYDDAIYDKNNCIEKIRHKYFLLSDSEMVQNGHRNWRTYGDKKCNKKYSAKDKIHNKAINSIFYINGKYYYIDKSYNFVRANKSGKRTIIKPIGRTKKIDFSDSISTVTNLPKLVYYNGYLYFNDCEKVYKYNISNKTYFSVRTLSKNTMNNSKFISDISIKANGKLYYGIKNYNTDKFVQKTIA